MRLKMITDDQCNVIRGEHKRLLAQKCKGAYWTEEHQARLEATHVLMDYLQPQMPPDAFEKLERMHAQYHRVGDHLCAVVGDLLGAP